MFLSQLKSPGGDRAVAARDGDNAWIVHGAGSTRELALTAIAATRGLGAEIRARGQGEAVDLAAALAEGRVLLPLDHDDPAHLHLTGTGLTHLGSAATRDAMHARPDADALTDSMKMFRMGLEGGKPRGGAVGVQPEWFWKGNGANAVAPARPWSRPALPWTPARNPKSRRCI